MGFNYRLSNLLAAFGRAQLGTLEDRARRVRAVRFETPFALAAYPWLWDFGTDGGTYGVFRTDKERTGLTQQVGAQGKSWKVDTSAGAEPRTYEQSVPGRAPAAMGWGHLLDATNAIAFAAERFASAPGTEGWTIDGQGHLTFERTPAAGSAWSSIVLYQHYVGTPVPIGAATPPVAMVSPLRVSLIR